MPRPKVLFTPSALVLDWPIGTMQMGFTPYHKGGDRADFSGLAR